ncbi:MAG TPA: hypothetical protein PKC76_07495 [Saprospiraceae bacterium]|nr:hypothetical protein [Saprospiraceae bacterium]HMP23957.1 hypothetical protein [Saprospiraceae bacterium]
MFEEIGVKHNIAVQYILENTDGTISRENILKHGYSQPKNVLPAEYQIFYMQVFQNRINMNYQTIRFFGTVVLFTILNVFIVTYFSLDIPIKILLRELRGNLIFAIISGVLVAIIIEWSMKKTREITEK